MLKTPINSEQFAELSKIMDPSEILQKYKLAETVLEKKKSQFGPLVYILFGICSLLLISNIFSALIAKR